jgi:indolepyruvate ferredoxin oxidoreductase
MALSLGRLAAAFPDELMEFAKLTGTGQPRTLTEMIESRRKHLAAYQNEAFARDYVSFVKNITARLQGRVTNPEPFLLNVANQLARLMAYKDEYEVARLYSLPSFREDLARQFDGDFKIALNLAPPLLAFRRDAKTGRPKKIEFEAWIFPLLRMMSRMKALRGTAFDPFGYTAERRMERKLIAEYRKIILSLADRITDATLAEAVEIAGAAHLVAGYGAVKEEGAKAYHARITALLAEFGRAKNLQEIAAAAE